jgi:argininosuccinate lyase
MTDDREYVSIGKMTHVPKECKYRGHGWFYERSGIGRLMEDTAPFDTYDRSIPEYYAYHLFDLSHVIMTTEEGIISREIGAKLLTPLKEMEKDGIDEARKKAGGVAHSGEAYLIQQLGWDVGGYIHAGRSSNDLRPCYHRIQQRHLLLDVADEVNGIRESLLNLAEEHVETILPEYTAIQHARPMTLGFYFESFVTMLERKFEMFELAYKHTNISPCGTADGSGSDFPINLQRTAELAGFDGVFDNALDVYHNYDFRLEAFALLAAITDVTARLGDDIQLWCSYEFRMADVADRYAGTSSIMSQKKNPSPRRLVDINEDVRRSMLYRGHDFKPLENAIRLTINSIRFARGLIETTTWKTDRMRELCEYGFMCNAALCRILVQEKGLPWRTTHQITAIMTRRALEEGMAMADITPEFIDECAMKYVGYGKPLNVSEEMLKEAFSVENSVMTLLSHGGTAPVRVKEQIVASRERLKRDNALVAEKRNRLKSAEEKRENAITALTSKRARI